MMRLRAGNRHGAGRVPSGASPSSTPRSRDRRPELAWRGGYGTSCPLPTTPIGADPAAPASSAPRWAAPSMPEREPRHDRHPRRREVAPSSRAMPAPAPVQRRVPTIATRGPSSAREVALGEEHRRRVEVVGQHRRGTPGRSPQAGSATPGLAVATGRHVRRGIELVAGPAGAAPRGRARPGGTPPRHPTGRAARRGARGPIAGQPGEERRAARCSVARSSPPAPTPTASSPWGRPAARARPPRGPAPIAIGRAVEVGDRAGDPADAVQAACRQPTRAEGVLEQRAWRRRTGGATSSSRRTGRSALTAHPAPVGDGARAAATRSATAADGSPRGLAEQVVDARAAAPRPGGRSGRAAGPESRRRYRARAGARCTGSRPAAPPCAARARVHGGDEQEAGRDRGGRRRAGDPDDALLERLAQRVEHVRRELGQLVEEEHAVVRRADLARPEGGRAAPDERHRRRAVVRRPERRRAHQRADAAAGGRRPSGSGWSAAPPRRSSGGSRPGSRAASIVLPAPGGPIMSRWCPPAAASSSA